MGSLLGVPIQLLVFRNVGKPMKTPTKTTLVKEKIAEIIYDNFYGHGLSKEIDTATQAIEALVNDECQRVKSEAYNKGFWLAVEMRWCISHTILVKHHKE